MIFIAVGTPQARGGKANLSYIESAVKEIARNIDHYTVIVEKSTVPVYTNEWIGGLIERCGVPRINSTLFPIQNFCAKAAPRRIFFIPTALSSDAATIVPPLSSARSTGRSLPAPTMNAPTKFLASAFRTRRQCCCALHRRARN